MAKLCRHDIAMVILEADTMTKKKLAEKYEVSEQTIYKILRQHRGSTKVWANKEN